MNERGLAAIETMFVIVFLLILTIGSISASGSLASNSFTVVHTEGFSQGNELAFSSGARLIPNEEDSSGGGTISSTAGFIVGSTGTGNGGPNSDTKNDLLSR